jgi:mannose-6-phosphate isomerase-like protein (cupin superfamily)
MDLPRNMGTLVHTKDVRVAELEMAPNSACEAHTHTSATEQCVCLHGQLIITIEGGFEQHLSPGEKIEIPAGAEHQIINPGLDPSRYMVIQYGGAYDFVAKQSAP